MQRLLSWIVLYLISVLTSLLTSFMVGVGFYILGLIDELSTFWKLVAYLFGGTAFLSFIFTPAYYGSILAMSASEAIKQSRKGLRYIILSTYMLITSIIHIIVGLTENAFHLNTVIMCVYYIMLIVFGREMTLERTNDTKEKRLKCFKCSKIRSHARMTKIKSAPDISNKPSEVKETLFDFIENDADELLNSYGELSDEEKGHVENEIKSSEFVAFNLLSPVRGHIKEPMEINDNNKELVHKWLDHRTNSVYCFEVFQDGKANYYYTTKEIFDDLKQRQDNV